MTEKYAPTPWRFQACRSVIDEVVQEKRFSSRTLGPRAGLGCAGAWYFTVPFKKIAVPIIGHPRRALAR